VRVQGSKNWEWLQKRSDIVPSPEFKAIEAVDSLGRIHGMVGFDGWTENSVVLTIALENPASLRSLIHPASNYVFVQANRGIALAMIRGGNLRSQRLCKHAGLKEVYRVRDGIRVGEDIVIMELRREDCRWIESEHRKAA
jgi:hypothetical protein